MAAITQLVLVLIAIFLRKSVGQYRDDTPQYAQTLEAETLVLEQLLDRNPEVQFYLNPRSALIYSNSYVFDFPLSSSYRIGILIDPCRLNSYDCCMNVFGTAEYPALIKSPLEAERVFKYDVLANDTDVAVNYELVDENSNSIPLTAKRSSDDFQIFNTTCISKGVPYNFCAGRNYAYQRSTYRPPCQDNNSSLNVLAGCVSPDTGIAQSNCVAVAYSSNTFVPLCNSSAGPHCGTYLEVHMAHGTPYQPERMLISEVKITTRSVTGYYTTILPTTWKFNQSRVLCAYSESTLRIGSLVYIKANAPVCCCPPPYTSATRVGSFQCPIGPTDNGRFAYRSQSMADIINVDTLLLDYPFCSIDMSNNTDLMMCSVYDPINRRHYTRECEPAIKQIADQQRSWGSVDLRSLYDGKCPYYLSCGLTLDKGKCRKGDLRFTFQGSVGIVTALDNTNVIPQVFVTFNNGRTSYKFPQSMVKLETYPKSMYEIWWVVRSPTQYTVQKRKGFNVTSPKCTFDTTHNRFFPYAIADSQNPGTYLDNSITP